MEVVSTNEGDEDDGVIWFKCPQCQGFLPKLSGADLKAAPAAADGGQVPAETSAPPEDPAPSAEDTEDSLPWDSPADMMAALAAQKAKGATDQDEDDPLLGTEEASAAREPGSAADKVFAPEDETVFVPAVDGLDLDLDDDGGDDDEADEELGEPSPGEKGDEAGPAEPIMEYAALLAEKDVSAALPYRHWGTYEVGQCIHHLAWDDCGVVVAKEKLPGGRQVIKVYFQEAGVVRLIEQAPR